MGIGNHIHLGVVTEEIAFPVGVPAGSIPEVETAEYRVKRSFPEHTAPDSNGSDF